MAMHSCVYVLLACFAMVPVTDGGPNRKGKHNAPHSENKVRHGYSQNALFVGLTVVEDAVAKGVGIYIYIEYTYIGFAQSHGRI